MPPVQNGCWWTKLINTKGMNLKNMVSYTLCYHICQSCHALNRIVSPENMAMLENNGAYSHPQWTGSEWTTLHPLEEGDPGKYRQNNKLGI